MWEWGGREETGDEGMGREGGDSGDEGMAEGEDCLEMREWGREETGDEGMGEGGRRLEMNGEGGRRLG